MVKLKVKKQEVSEDGSLDDQEFEEMGTGRTRNSLTVELAEYREIPIEDISANEWNPNEMDEGTFNMLVDNLSGVGMNQTILVTPLRDASGNIVPGKFKIVDGEQRFRALQLSDMTIVPCMVKDNIDEDEQKFQTMRMNRIRGMDNKKKFQAMVQQMLNTGKYTVPELADKMGFVNEDEFRDLIDTVSTGLTGKVKKEFDKVKGELKTIDDLTVLLNKLFAKFGDTLPYNYMVMDFGGKKHLWIRMGEEKDFKTFKEKLEICQQEGVTVDSTLRTLVKKGFNKKFIDAVRSELKEVGGEDDANFAEMNDEFLKALGEIEEDDTL
jgi:hypothetical protein